MARDDLLSHAWEFYMHIYACACEEAASEALLGHNDLIILNWFDPCTQERVIFAIYPI